MALQNGFVGIDKPAGWTSQDLVSWVRKFLAIKKVGHTGTLDPMATGVMILCLGAYTRLSQYVVATTKAYRAVVRLGIATDTLDADGNVTRRSTSIPKSEDALETVLGALRGEIKQTPPMYSAIRIGGQRLYDLARQGQKVERPARAVQVYTLNALVYDPPLLHLDVVCSKGTYIRSIADEIGSQLGCGAHLVALRRTCVGPVGLECCTTLADLRSKRKKESLHEAVLDPRDVLSDLPPLSLTSDQLKSFGHGNQVIDISSKVSGTVRVVNSEGLMLGIGQLVGDVLKPLRVIQNQ